MDMLDSLQRARNVERFKDEQLQREDIISLIDAGRLAFSSNNQQVLRYTATRKEEAIKRLLPHLHTNQEGQTFSLIIVSAPVGSGHNVYIDLGAALQNMLLFATRQNWGLQHIDHFHSQKIANEISLEHDREVIAIIAAGQAETFSLRETITLNESTKTYLKDSHSHSPILSTKYLISWYE